MWLLRFGGKNANYFYCQGFQSGNEATITAVFDTEIQALHLSYYPNPSHDFIQIQWEKKGLISRFLLLDEKGALIHKFQINSNDKGGKCSIWLAFIIRLVTSGKIWGIAIIGET